VTRHESLIILDSLLLNALVGLLLLLLLLLLMAI